MHRLNLRWLLVGGLMGPVVVLLLLMVFSEGNITGKGHWHWVFPAFLIGSSANQCAITAVW